MSAEAAASADALRICPVSPAWREPLARFFAALRENGDERTFHPHPMDAAAAARIAEHAGRDLYYVMARGTEVLGYGMLRGWDEGYEVPSLGIGMAPAARGLGLARLLMSFLHAAARLRGAPRVRLTVYPDNEPAVALYRSLGYRLRAEADGRLVGFWEP